MYYFFIKKIVDPFGYVLFNHNKNIHIDLNSIKSIAIVNLGHIGDNILMLPMLDSLRDSFKGRIILVVNPYVYEIVKLFNMIDDVIAIPHPILSRDKSSSWLKTFKTFKNLEADIIFNADSYSYSLFFLHFSKKKILIGYDIYGLGFLLDVILKYPYHKHITERYYGFIDCIGVKRENIKNLFEYLNIQRKNYEYNDYIILSIGSGAQSRDWPDKNYIRLISLIRKKLPDIRLFLVGKIKRERLRIYEDINDNFVINFLNKTSIKDVIYLISNAKVFVGLESGLTHISALLGVKTLALYSGTTEIGVWEPISVSDNVTVLRENVNCNNKGLGCNRAYCLDNICMKNISPDVVFSKILEILKRS